MTNAPQFKIQNSSPTLVRQSMLWLSSSSQDVGSSVGKFHSIYVHLTDSLSPPDFCFLLLWVAHSQPIRQWACHVPSMDSSSKDSTFRLIKELSRLAAQIKSINTSELFTLSSRRIWNAKRQPRNKLLAVLRYWRATTLPTWSWLKLSVTSCTTTISSSAAGGASFWRSQERKRHWKRELAIGAEMKFHPSRYSLVINLISDYTFRLLFYSP